MTIKPIETHYNGYRFRSRLEARWAVFFDITGIEYRYEAGGFNMDGVWYLPDFWLPQHRCYIEIKPFWPNEQECEKAIRLCIGSKQVVIILAGDVWVGAHKAIRYSPFEVTPALKEFAKFLSLHSSEYFRSPNHSILISEEDEFFRVTDYQRGFVCRDMGMDELFLKEAMPDEDKIYTQDEINDYVAPRLAVGYLAARQVRFEHGEMATCPYKLIH